MTWSKMTLSAIDALGILFGVAMAVPALLVILAPLIVTI